MLQNLVHLLKKLWRLSIQMEIVLCLRNEFRTCCIGIGLKNLLGQNQIYKTSLRANDDVEKITNLQVEYFLTHDLQHLITTEDVCVCDGASIHRHPNSRRHIDGVFHGNWIIGPRYSHDFFPIEKGFANVWKYVRRHEERAECGGIIYWMKRFCAIPSLDRGPSGE